MVKDKVFVCERCQVRLEKDAKENKTLKTVKIEWSRDLHRRFKQRYKNKHGGEKPSRRLVRTSCLGLCPKERVVYEELKDGQIKRTKTYKADLDEEALYRLFFEVPPISR